MVLALHDAPIDQRTGNRVVYAASWVADRNSMIGKRNTFKRFISATPDPWFDRIPVWIEACDTRLVSRGRNPARDERNRAEIMELEARYGQLCEAQPPGPLSNLNSTGMIISKEVTTAPFSSS